MFRNAKIAKPVAQQIDKVILDATVVSNICLQADSEEIRSALVSVNRYFYFSYQPMRITKKLLELVRASKKDRVMQMIPLHPECLFANYGDDKSPFHAAMTIGDTDLLESMEPYIYLVPNAAETMLKQTNRLLDQIHAFVPYDFKGVVNVISNASYENNTIDPDSKRELEKFKSDFMVKTSNTGFDFDLENLTSFIRTGIKKSREAKLSGSIWKKAAHFKTFKSTVFLDLLHCMPVSDLQMYCQGMDDILIYKTKFSRFLISDLLAQHLYDKAFNVVTARRLVPMEVARRAKIYYLEQLRGRLELSLVYADMQDRQAHALLGYVLRGEAAEAVTLIAANPALLFVRSTNKTVTEKEYVDITPFEAMLGAGDTYLLEEVEPYLSKVPNGYQIAAELFAKQFPEGVDAYAPIIDTRELFKSFSFPKPVNNKQVIEQFIAMSEQLDAFLDVDSWNQRFDNRSNQSTGLHFNLLYLLDFVEVACMARSQASRLGYEDKSYNLICARMIVNILRHVSACDAQAICHNDSLRRHDRPLKRSINLTGDLPGENFYTRLSVDYDHVLSSAILNAIGVDAFFRGDYESDEEDDDNQKGYYRPRMNVYFENKIKKLIDFQSRLKVYVAQKPGV